VTVIAVGRQGNR